MTRCSAPLTSWAALPGRQVPLVPGEPGAFTTVVPDSDASATTGDLGVLAGATHDRPAPVRDVGVSCVDPLVALADRQHSSLAETAAAIASARRSRRLSRITADAAARQLDEEWSAVTSLVVDGPVTRLAATLARRHRLRGIDAIHLASALPLRPARVVVVTFDRMLGRAARAEGLAVTIGG